MAKASSSPVYHVTSEWANVSSPRPQPRVSPHAAATVVSPRRPPPTALSPRMLPHLEHHHHFGWTKPSATLPTTSSRYGSGWAMRATDSRSPRAPGETSIKRLAEADASWKFIRAPEPLDPDRFWSPTLTAQANSPRVGAPRSPRSPRLKRTQHESTPHLQLISWPGHSTFVKRVARPPALNSVAVRRGDYPLMQRQLMDVAGH